MWSLREIKVRYKQSVLGAAWAILQPLVMTLIFTLVFSFFARIPTDGVPYPLFSYTALLPWTFFATSITFAVPSLIKNMNLVTKVNFPREILPTAAIVAAFADFLVASTVFVGLLFFYRLPLHASVLWLPPLLAVQIMLTLGLALLGAALIVWYRDVRFVVPLVLQFWLYASPIIYPISLVPERWRTVYMLNPMAGLIDSYRRVLLQGRSPQLLYVAISAGVAVVLLVAGYAYFKRSEAQFADII
jgi:lipopolysaccharide transport system permease protein